AGTPTNALYLDSTGRAGFLTATPVLDVHVNTGNTPAMRLEQNGGAGWGTQTWDIAGNEANWFVRDVTGGSRLPFRIRPGAPTSSVDISASGNVGIGTASPTNKLQVVGTGPQIITATDTSATGYSGISMVGTGTRSYSILMGGPSEAVFGVANKFAVYDNQAGAMRVVVDTSGNVGIGTAS